MHHRSTITIPKDRETIFREALCREESVRLHRVNEARIVEKLEDLFIPLPTFTAEEKIAMWKRINLIKFIKSLAP